MAHLQTRDFGGWPCLLLVAGILSAPSSTLAQNGAWTDKAPLPTARLGLATCVVDGKLYAIGGEAAAGLLGLPTVEEYDPVSDAWTERAPMPTRRMWLVCAAVDGVIYAIGGFRTEGDPALNTVEAYDVAADSWTTVAPMLTARKGAAAAAVDGKVYVLGGANEMDEWLPEVEMYDPATNAWTARAPMPTSRAMLAASVVDGTIYAIGGPWPTLQGIRTVEAYDPAADIWSTRADMPTGRLALTASTVHGHVYAIGGASGSSGESVVEEYDPAADEWATITSMPENEGSEAGNRWGLASGVVGDTIYVVGGSETPAEAPHPATSLVQAYTVTEVATGVAGPGVDYGYPTSAVLYPNFPNPFSPATNIAFDLPSAEVVHLSVYDVRGRMVEVLIDGMREAGHHDVTFDRAGWPSGTYFYRLETPDGRLTRSMLLVH